MLQGVETSETETIQVDVTDYDDGSAGLTIDITYPAK